MEEKRMVNGSSNKQEYNKFKKMVDKVGQSIMDAQENPALFFSGGVDSTAMALSFMKTNKPFYLVHMTNLMRNDTIRRNHKILENIICHEFSQRYNLPIIYYPTVINRSPYAIAKKIGIGSFILGEGMDRAYGVCADKREPKHSMGEDYHAYFPLVDIFLKTFPTRIKYFKTEYDVDGNVGKHDIELMEKYKVEMIKFSKHPEWIKFFSNYEKSLRDVFFPKYYTYRYVEKNLGMKYYAFVKYVIRQHKKSFDPMFYRVIHQLSDFGLTLDHRKLYRDFEKG